MRRLDWNALDDRQRVDALARPPQARDVSLRNAVADIIARVRRDGDAALRALTEQHDHCVLDTLEVGADEFDAAGAGLPTLLKDAIVEAATRIEHYHRATMLPEVVVDTAPGVRVERVSRAVDSVGLYVPAGSAPLPSTVLMLGIPARLAGCAQVVMCSPARADGHCDPAVLFAARQVGVQRVFKLGGAQAIAAMAYGTASVPRSDKLFGPGNAWVTEAKLQVANDVDGAAIDMPAGPSEVMVLADECANPAFVAADLLSQAEHGPDSQVMLVTPSVELLDAVEREVTRQCAQLPRRDIATRALAGSRLIRVHSLAQAVQVANAYAPEHLLLQVDAPRALLAQVRHAGSVFLGNWAPESVGDYCSGSNHVLPTYGHARRCSGLSVASYQRQITVQELTAEGLRAIGPCVTTLAEAEQLHAHARAVSVRLQALDTAGQSQAVAGGVPA
jgi:histidinol dehydrogenase